MQNYIELRVKATPSSEDISDLIAAFLVEIGYESFVEDEGGVTKAYVKKELFSLSEAKEALSDFPIDCQLEVTSEEIEGKDWNEEWEKNYFHPIVVDGECVVHSSFHKDVPTAKYDIVIDPKMAFGTGHHSTTYSMMRHILDSDMKGKSVIDMGTGTGILAILSKMRGASEVTGIEIDPDAYENAVENCRLNNSEITMICGDAASLERVKPADVFMANINRNVILGDIDRYIERISAGGELFLSGFYKEDIPLVDEAASARGLKLEKVIENENWVALRYRKPLA